MKEFSYKNYSYQPFFEHYFKHNPENPIGNVPEPILIDLKSKIPSYVDTIINLGCSNGRDFIPFQDDYNCIGFDLAPLGYIDWVCKTKNLTYYQCSIEDYMNNVITTHLQVHMRKDLSTSLVYTQGALCYVSPNNQEKFISHLLDNNCKNMIFHEYPPEYTGIHSNFTFQPCWHHQKYLDLFERKKYKGECVGFIHLDR
jgi:hypothetical protein